MHYTTIIAPVSATEVSTIQIWPSHLQNNRLFWKDCTTTKLWEKKLLHDRAGSDQYIFKTYIHYYNNSNATMYIYICLNQQGTHYCTYHCWMQREDLLAIRALFLWGTAVQDVQARKVTNIHCTPVRHTQTSVHV